MSFKLNIGGKMTGKGTTGFGQKASAVIEKCKSMANYMGTLETNVTEAPMNFNAGLRKASADGKLNDSPKFKSAVDGSGMNMNDSSMYKKDEFGTEIPDDFVDDSGSGGVTGTLTEFDSSDYTRGGNPAEVGQRRTDGGEVLDDYRDSKGKKKAGRTGQIKVKGVKFS
tara:strand:+ start:288 stop:791 length:504 start_codon:yes stop_codon:yes gene_type:complete